MNHCDRRSGTMNAATPSRPMWRWVMLMGLLLTSYSTAVTARPGYAGLINSYCKAKDLPKVRNTDDGCAMCHHEGTFTTDPSHRVQPTWSEFEKGRAADDFSFFCPANGDTPAAPAPISLAGGNADATPPPTNAEDSMAWMALGFPTGHAMTERARGPAAGGKNVTSPLPDKAASKVALPSRGGVRAADPAADTKRQLAALHHDLAIDRRQESVWQELQDAVLAASMDEGTTAVSSADLKFVLQERERRLAQRTARSRAINTASIRLRAQLNDKQQRLLAQRLPPLLGKP